MKITSEANKCKFYRLLMLQEFRDESCVRTYYDKSWSNDLNPALLMPETGHLSTMLKLMFSCFYKTKWLPLLCGKYN